MPKARYRFTRNKSVQADLSSDRPSTNALKALGVWCDRGAGRDFSKVLDEDEQLVADLSWSESDESAGPSLDEACGKFGVVRIHEIA